MSFETIPVSVRAAAVDGTSAVIVGDLVDFRCSGVAPALIASATDAYALALILSPKILPNWPLSLTVDITADTVDLNGIVTFLAARLSPGQWALTFENGVEIVFQATPVNSTSLSTTAGLVRYVIELLPIAGAELDGGDIVTVMLDFRAKQNALPGLIFGAA